MPKIEIKNLEKAGQRILRAIKDNELIIIYGDSDLDGVSSVIIFKETITSAGAKNYFVYFPHREEQGYGINEKSLAFLKDKAPALFVALDCGIGNVKEIDLANKMGFEVLVIDHHEPLDAYPKALIIVDPKQEGDKYPFKEFANVGLVFKLASHILKNPESLRKSFLELVAMATIADMMPREEDNENMIMEGMGYLEESWRPGIKSLYGLKAFKGLTLSEKISRVNSLLNIIDIKNGLPAAYRILTEPDIRETEELAERLLEKGEEKKIRIREIIAETEEKIFNKNDNIIFEGDDKWELILLGVVASVISNNHQKPCFLYRRHENDSQGSVRAPEGFNTVEAMKTCKDFLLTYGGHPRASGFKLKNEDLDKFKERLIKYFNKI